MISLGARPKHIGVAANFRTRTEQNGYEAPMQDAQRALSLVRIQASRWHIATNRVGMLGFSAGGHLSALASCQSGKRTYKPVDAADELSCQPGFTVLV